MTNLSENERFQPDLEVEEAGFGDEEEAGLEARAHIQRQAATLQATDPLRILMEEIGRAHV